MYKQCFSLVALLLPLLAGCGADTLAVAGLTIEIRDARNGAQAWYDATVIIQDGAYVETLRGPYGLPREDQLKVVVPMAAFNRPGTYDVTITHPEYQTWRREGVRVRNSGESSPFHPGQRPETVRILAQLQPLAPD